MSIIHNILGMNAQRQYGIVTGAKRKSTEKLSSGYRVNRSADDVAGLAISEKMRRQIRGLNQASQNIQDGIGFCQVADGYLNEVHDIMQRMNELAVKSANGTNTSEDRSYMDSEVQELKDELHRIFSTAEFNEKKIWTVPYLPEIRGEAQDAQVFGEGIGANGKSVPGGVEINDIRYNWEELGFDLSADGTRFTGNQEFRAGDDPLNPVDYTGERVILRVNGDTPVGNVARDYQWRADDTGILINNVRACTWSEIGVQEENNHGEKEFDFRGQHVSFEVEDGDSLQDVINGINGEGFYTNLHWDFVAYGDLPQQPALHIREGCILTASNANEDIFDNTFAISANEDGVKVVNLTNPSDASHQMMNWSDFKGTARSDFEEPYEWMKEEARDHGAEIDMSFPIVDWGLDQDANGKTDVTFDDSVYYQYQDSELLPITFTYDLKDETSRDAAVNALDGARFYGYLDAPGETKLSNTNSADDTKITLVRDYIDQNFALQRTLKRDFDAEDFDDPKGKILGNVQRVYVKDDERTARTEGEFSVQSKLIGTERELEPEEVGEVYYERDGHYYKAELTIKNSSFQEAQSKQTDEHFAGTYRYSGSMGTERGSVALEDYEVYREYSKRTVESQERTVTQKDYVYSDVVEISAEVYDAAAEGKKQDYQGNPVHSEGAWTTDITRGYEVNGRWYSYEPTFEDDIVFKTQEGGDKVFEARFEFHVESKNAQETCVDFTPDRKVTRQFLADENSYGNTFEHYSFNESRMYPPKKSLYIQSGVEAHSGLELTWDTLNLAIVGLAATNVETQGAANAAIRQVKHAISFINQQRSDFGAQQNRLEHAYQVDRNSEENTQAAESKIRDTDMAKEMLKFSNSNILAQVGESMIAQANQTKQGILSLLQ